MLEVESAISPQMIAARGYGTASSAADIPEGFEEYQYRANMFPTLVIPQYNAVGRQFGYVLRADNPRRDFKTGKVIKYESQPGGRVAFDYNPAMVDLLRDPSVPLYITEGSKKADAMASRGLLCISLNGVYGFMSKRMIASELDELALDGREVRLIFDDDVMTKPGVADALYRLSAAIDRRGGRVQNVLLVDPGNPTTPAGAAKIGVDDYFAKGGTVEGLNTLTSPWQPVSRPNNVILYPDPYERIVELERTVSAQARLILSPHYTESEKKVIYRSGSLSQANGNHDDRGDGTVEIDAGRIANDFRPTDRSRDDYEDYRRSPVNPNGEFWFMPRASVASTVEGLHKKLGDASPLWTEKSLRKRRGQPRMVVMRKPRDIAEYLDGILAYVPDDVPNRPYRKQDPCPHCGEVHERTVIRQAICGTEDDPGCGAIIDEKALTLPVPPASRPDITDEERADLDRQTTAPGSSRKYPDNKGLEEPREKFFPSPALGTSCQENILRNGTDPRPDSGTCVSCEVRPAASHDRNLCETCRKEQIDRLMYGEVSWVQAS